jgi:hypothetical protein
MIWGSGHPQLQVTQLHTITKYGPSPLAAAGTPPLIPIPLANSCSPCTAPWLLCPVNMLSCVGGAQLDGVQLSVSSTFRVEDDDSCTPPSCIRFSMVCGAAHRRAVDLRQNMG